MDLDDFTDEDTLAFDAYCTTIYMELTEEFTAEELTLENLYSAAVAAYS